MGAYRLRGGSAARVGSAGLRPVCPTRRDALEPRGPKELVCASLRHARMYDRKALGRPGPLRWWTYADLSSASDSARCFRRSQWNIHGVRT